MTDRRERPQPQNEDAERAVLGSLLQDRDAIIRIATLLRPDDFFVPRHRVIYQAMCDLVDDRVPVDLLPLNDRLERAGQIEHIGGAVYLAQLMTEQITAVHVEYYASLVREASIRRRYLSASLNIARLAYDESQPLTALAAGANSELMAATSASISDAYIGLAEAVALMEERLNQERRHEQLVRTGYADLDAVVGGFEPGQLIIIGARPSVGKSAVGVQIASQHSIKENRPGGFISLEMSVPAVIERLTAIHGQINMHAYKRNRSPRFEERQRVMDASGKVSNGKLKIVRRVDGLFASVAAQAREMHARDGIECLIIDYIQLMRTDNHDNRTQEVSAISRGLKLLAMDLEIPIIALAQLNRALEQRGADAVPRLSDLRESGSLEADADIVIFPHRQVNVPIGEFQEASFIIAKHREGPTGSISMLWKPDTAEFVAPIRMAA